MSEPYSTVEIELKTPTEELVKYIQERLHHAIPASKIDTAPQIIDNVQNTVAAKAAGIFVLTRLYMDYVTKNRTFDDILNVLARLPREQEQYFDDLKQEVMQQENESDHSVALAALAIAAAAWDTDLPMRFEEHVGALQVLRVTDEIDVDSISRQKLVDITKGFLNIEPAPMDRVIPFHVDVGTYLMENCTDIFEPIRLDMALLCITALVDARPFFEDIGSDPRVMLERLDARPFIRYALSSWASYLDQTDSKEAQQAAIDFLDNHYTSPGLQQLSLLTNHESWAGSHKLHVCAWFGMTKLYLESYQDLPVDETDILTGRTPLMVASNQGHLDFVHALLIAKADRTLACNRGHTALWEAVSEGHVDIVQELLKRRESSSATFKREDSCHELPTVSKIQNEFRTDIKEMLNYQNDHASGQTVLMAAIIESQDEILEALLNDQDIDTARTDLSGRTALHLAADVGNMDALKLLVQRPDAAPMIDLRDDTTTGRNALMYVLASDHWGSDKIVAVEFLISHGAGITSKDNLGRTALHYAASDRALTSVLQLLLDSGFDKNSEDQRRWTPLHTACAFETLENVKVLLACGADRDAKDIQQRTPFDVAWLFQNKLIMEALGRPPPMNDHVAVWAQITFDAQSFLDTNPGDLLGISNAAILERDPLMHTALHCAVEAGNSKVVQRLLDDGRVDINATNIRNQTALNLALTYLCSRKRREKMKIILKLFFKKTDKLDFEQADYHGNRALDLAARRGNWDFIRQILDAQAEICLPQKQVQDLFMLAVEKGSPVTVKRLLEAGADVLQTSSDGDLPWKVAFDKGADDEVLSLLAAAEKASLDCFERCK